MESGPGDARFVSGIVDFGMNVSVALESPRFTRETLDGCDVQMGETFPADVPAGLAQRGHSIRLPEPFAFSMRHGAAVVRDRSRRGKLRLR